MILHKPTRCFIVLLSLLAAIPSGMAQPSAVFRQVDSLLAVDPAKAETELLEITENTDLDPYLRGIAHRRLAQIFNAHSRKHEEIEHLFKSYWAFKRSGKQHEETEAQRLIGNYYRYLGLLKESERYLNASLEQALQIKDTLLIISILSNKAQLETEKENFAEALSFYQIAIELSNIKHYPEGLMLNWNRISYLYWKTGQPKKMLEAMRKAVKHNISQNSDTLAVLYGDLGLAYMENQQLDSANYYLEAGYNLLADSRNRVQQIVLTGLLASLREKQNRLKESVQLLHLRDSIRNRVFTSQLKDEVAYAESRYKRLVAESELVAAKKRQQVLILAILSGLILLALLTGVIFWLRNNNRFIRRQKVKLNDTLNKLRENENFLMQLLNNNPSYIFTHTLDGTILTANQTAVMAFWEPGKSLAGKLLWEVLPPKDPEKKQFETFFDNLRKKAYDNGWLGIVNPQGYFRSLRYISKMISPKNKAPFAITFALDDTDVFNARSEAERERQRLLLVMDNSPDIYAILDRSGKLLYMNKPYFFGRTRNIIGKNIAEFMPPDIHARFERNLSCVFEEKLPIEYEENINERIYSIKLIPIITKDEVREVLSVSTDVTEKRKREVREKELNQIIENNEKRYRNLVESSLVLICSHDLNGVLLTVNTAGAKSVGYTVEELIGRNLSEFIPDEYQTEFRKYIEQMREHGLYEGFLTVCTKNGDRRILLCRNVLMKDQDIVLGSAQDVTEWKKAEFREKKITQELQAAKEKAEESNRLKTIFLGSLSHEVRTPLQGILGFAEILEKPFLPDDKRKEYSAIIKRRSLELQNIIEALLDIACVETGEVKPTPVDLDIFPFVELLLDALQKDYNTPSSISLQFENRLSPGVRVYIDPQHLKQVLVNLFGNAVKFTKEGSIRVVFEHLPGRIQFSVSDTGIGIAPDRIEQIFQPFRQAHEGISRAKGGIGLGLAISKKFIELWGGTITVSSSPGNGSTFCVTIPIIDNTPESKSDMHKAEPA